MTPIIIANTKPFRLIIRDDNDKWETTLKEINTSSYDYVKLHRASRFFDAHLSSQMPVCLGFDGSIILPFSEHYHNDDIVLEEINRIIASVFLGGIYIESISPLDIAKGSMNVTGYFRHNQTFGGNSVFHFAIGSLDAGVSANIHLLEPDMIIADDYIKAYNDGHSILKALPTLSPSLFISSFTYFKNYQLREALTHAWIGIEQIVENLWDQIITAEASKNSIPKRRKFLDSQQWNSAHKIELLFQKNVINSEIYKVLNMARVSRNSFIHSGNKPDYQSCFSAIQALILLIEVSTKLNSIPFSKDKIEAFISDINLKCIPQTFVPKKKDIKPIKDARYWKEIIPIPGDDNWEGDFDTFEDITLRPIK